jgi:hypothetical protein
MTKGQMAQLRDLSKCYMGNWSWDRRFVSSFEFVDHDSYRLAKSDKAILRRLTHQYRNQIRAIKRNQERA